MTKSLDFETLIENKHNARMARDAKNEERLSKREDVAARMIGELSSGKLYVFPVGGTYREGSRAELVSFLLRNNYA